MDIGVYSINSTSDASIGNLLDQRSSFVLEDIGRTKMGEAVETLEKLISSRGMRCRVYTKGRAAIMATTWIPTPVTIIGGLASALAIGAHDLATLNPDYEIAKNLATGTLTVNYKK
jgi:hypothetical protein